MKDLIIRTWGLFYYFRKHDRLPFRWFEPKSCTAHRNENNWDTTVTPVSPGASVTEPRPGDTTQAHRDSLKMEKNISDSSAKSGDK